MCQGRAGHDKHHSNSDVAPALKDETLPSRSSKCGEEANSGWHLQPEEHRKGACRGL